MDVTHLNVTNLLCQLPGNLGMRPGIKVAQLLSISFDMGKRHHYIPLQDQLLTLKQAAWEILGALMNGASLHLRTSDWSAVLRVASFTAISRSLSHLRRLLGRYDHRDTLDSL